MDKVKHKLGSLKNVSVILTFFFVMMRRHKIDIIFRCYSDIEICQIILGDLQRDFRESRENLLQGKLLL